MKLISMIMRRLQAELLGAPFRLRVWYNYRAMLPDDKLEGKKFVEIFDQKGAYIECPEVGGTVVYRYKGKRYLYRVVGFENESRNRDWLYSTDYIHPIIEFVKLLK